MIELSRVFDAGYYSASYPDLMAAGLTTSDQLFNHFISAGITEGRGFSPYINLNYYEAVNPDLGAAGLTTGRQLLDHLVGFGINEKRPFSPNVNLDYYAAANADLGAAGLTTGEQLFDHLINFAAREGRQIAPPPPEIPNVAPPNPVLPPDDSVPPPTLPPGVPAPPAPPLPPELPELPPLGAFSGLSTTQQRSLSANSVESLVAAGLDVAKAHLNTFGTAPDFSTKINTAFGETVNLDAAKTLIQNMAKGQALPGIEVLSAAELGGAQGAFDAITNTAYLSKEFLAGNAGNFEAIANVLLEEIGHSIDSRLNSVDAPGDEGAIFAALVQGKDINSANLYKLKNEEDRLTIPQDNARFKDIELSKQWTLWIYDYTNFQGWNRPISSTQVDSNLNGIHLDWGTDSADKFNQVYFGNLQDNFIALSGTFAYFDAGQTYRFRANADDQLFLLASPYYNSSNSSWITPGWQRFDHSQGPPNDRYYKFTPKETGWHIVYAAMYEEKGSAYIDTEWKTFAEGVAEKNGETRPIHIESIDASPITDRPTWLVIHGNANTSKNMEDLAGAIKANQPDAQVLTLDWGSAANTDPNSWNAGLDKSTPWIEPVAAATRNMLNDLGISNHNLNLIGHSLGTYVSWELANRTPGGVHHLVALDPAKEIIGGGYISSGKRFDDISDNSWAFFGSFYGSEGKANTADESFKMKFPSNVGSNEAHGGVHQAFANMLKTGSNGYISDYFDLDEMGNSWRPWYLQNGFEGTIEVVNTNQGWSPYSMVHNNGSLLEAIA